MTSVTTAEVVEKMKARKKPEVNPTAKRKMRTCKSKKAVDSPRRINYIYSGGKVVEEVKYKRLSKTMIFEDLTRTVLRNQEEGTEGGTEGEAEGGAEGGEEAPAGGEGGEGGSNT